MLKLTLARGAIVGVAHGVTSAESQRVFEDARTLGQSMTTSPEHITVLGGLAAGKIFRGEMRDARNMTEEILALARGDESPHVHVTAHCSAGTALMYLGEIEAAIWHLEQAVAAGEMTPTSRRESLDYDPVVPARMLLGFARVLSGRPQTGRPWIESALQIARANHLPWYLGFALNTAAALAVIRRDFVEARRLASEVLAYGEEMNLANWKDMNRIALGWVDAIETGEAAVLPPMREAVEAFSLTGNAVLSRMYGLLAEACLAAGRVAEAAQQLDVAFDRRGEVRLFDAELLRVRARILVLRAQTADAKEALLEEAEQTLEKAIEVTATQGTLLFGLRATIDLCRVRRATGKGAQARERLAAAFATFDEGFDETDLREARALLDELNV